ncbi:MAG: O-antigen ligase family protein [Parachlamydiaceae bacterium]|nr:O-antigen ligase family protein [Parachlamydiaceae bacterium]
MNIESKYAFNSPSIQRALNLFAFLLAFPGTEVLGNSLYFYVFLWILHKTYRHNGYIFNYNTRIFKLIFVMFLLGITSTILQPELLPGRASMVSSTLFALRYAYWFLICIYFYSWYNYINIKAISKFIFWGYIAQIIGFYFLSFRLDLALFSINTGMTRNGFVFNSIAFSGFIYYYFFNLYGKKSVPWVTLGVILNLLLTNGRAGAVVGLLIGIVSYAILYPKVTYLLKSAVVMVSIATFSGAFTSENLYRIGGFIAPYVQTFSPRFAGLLTKTGIEGDLDLDKSWLIRELMVTKAHEIIELHPLIGIGYGNFTSFDAPLDKLYTAQFYRLSGETREYYNTRSGHNGYAEYVSETGLIGFSLFLLLIIPILWRILFILWMGRFQRYGSQFLILVSFLGVTIHLYSIASLTGANYWFLLGVSSAILAKNQFGVIPKL